MKTIKLSGRVHKFAILFAMALFLFPAVSCAQRVSFNVSSVTPAAKGTVKSQGGQQQEL